MQKQNLLSKFEKLPESVMDYSDNDWKIYWGKGDYDLLEQLCKLPKDTTIYTIVHHVSSSGMMRHMEMFYLEDNQKIPIRFLTEEVFLYKLSKKTDYYHVGGCGMDMGFSLVHSLSYTISNELKRLGKLKDQDGYWFKQAWF